MEISTNMYGICAMKKFIAHCTNEIFIQQTLEQILNNFGFLVHHPVGNCSILIALEVR